MLLSTIPHSTSRSANNLQRPTGSALRRFSPGQGNQTLPRTGYGAGFSLTLQPLLPPVQLLLAPQGPLQTLFHPAAAHPFHLRSARLRSAHLRSAHLRGPGIASSFMAPSAWFASQQQDAGLSLLVSCRPPLENRRPQFLLLLLPQLHPVFLHLHHPLTSQSSFVTTRYDIPAITSKLVVYQAVLTFETSGDFANPSSSFPLSRESNGRSLNHGSDSFIIPSPDSCPVSSTG